MMHSPHLSPSYTIHITTLASAQGAGGGDDSESSGETVSSGALRRGPILSLPSAPLFQMAPFIKFTGNIGHLREKYHGKRNGGTKIPNEVLMIS